MTCGHTHKLHVHLTDACTENDASCIASTMAELPPPSSPLQLWPTITNTAHRCVASRQGPIAPRPPSRLNCQCAHRSESPPRFLPKHRKGQLPPPDTIPPRVAKSQASASAPPTRPTPRPIHVAMHLDLIAPIPHTIEPQDKPRRRLEVPRQPLQFGDVHIGGPCRSAARVLDGVLRMRRVELHVVRARAAVPRDATPPSGPTPPAPRSQPHPPTRPAPTSRSTLL